MIDNMYRRAVPTAQAPAPVAASLSPAASAANAATLTSQVHMITNRSSLQSLLDANRAVVVFFTSDTCPPCKMIHPAYRDISAEKGREGVAFGEVNMSRGMSSMLAQELRVSATPTFMFFVGGKKVCSVRFTLWGFHWSDSDVTQTAEIKGANARELRTQVDIMLYDAFPGTSTLWLPITSRYRLTRT